MCKAFFLDRDGVINKNAPEHDYIKDWDSFVILEGVLDAIQFIKQYGYLVIVITNQRGISKGVVSRDVVNQIHDGFNKILLKSRGVQVDAFYLCPHDYSDNCNCRKPRVGMVLEAVSKFNINLSSSWLIGDSDTDIELAKSLDINHRKMERDGNLYKIVKNIFDQMYDI